jgi:hypothetical protein
MLDWIHSFWIENFVQRSQMKKLSNERWARLLQGRFCSRSTEHFGPKRITRLQNWRFNNVISSKFRWSHPLALEKAIIPLRPNAAISCSSLSGGSVGYFFMKSYYWCEHHILMNLFWGISRGSEINRDLPVSIQTFIWLSAEPCLTNVQQNTANWMFTIVCLIYCVNFTDENRFGSETETQNAVGIYQNIENLSGCVSPTLRTPAERPVLQAAQAGLWSTWNATSFCLAAVTDKGTWRDATTTMVARGSKRTTVAFHSSPKRDQVIPFVFLSEFNGYLNQSESIHTSSTSGNFKIIVFAPASGWCFLLTFNWACENGPWKKVTQMIKKDWKLHSMGLTSFALTGAIGHALGCRGGVSRLLRSLQCLSRSGTSPLRTDPLVAATLRAQSKHHSQFKWIYFQAFGSVRLNFFSGS